MVVSGATEVSSMEETKDESHSGWRCRSVGGR